MKRQDTNERAYATLMRMAALFFALADIAARAARLPAPVRAVVLALLRPAEAGARSYVSRALKAAARSWMPEALDPSAALSLLSGADNRRDADRLARTFRALGRLLQVLAECLQHGASAETDSLAASNLMSEMASALRAIHIFRRPEVRPGAMPRAGWANRTRHRPLDAGAPKPAFPRTSLVNAAA